MKSILLVCNQLNIDSQLRRSLAHLTRSCQVELFCSGFAALAELNNRAFDLIIIDSDLDDFDCLELTESITYIDPDVPVIVMLAQNYKSLWGTVRQLNANPILRPFKPITFLRLIDTLLHQHLERFRELARTLELTLENLLDRTASQIVFLADASGQILSMTGTTDDAEPETLAEIAASQLDPDAVDFAGTYNHSNGSDPAATGGLFAAAVTESLILALYQESATEIIEQVWESIDSTIREIRHAFQESTPSGNILLQVTGHTAPDGPTSRCFVPLAGIAADAAVTTALEADKFDEELPSPSIELEPPLAPVNWQLIPDSSNLLNRLQSFCQINQ